MAWNCRPNLRWDTNTLRTLLSRGVFIRFCPRLRLAIGSWGRPLVAPAQAPDAYNALFISRLAWAFSFWPISSGTSALSIAELKLRRSE